MRAKQIDGTQFLAFRGIRRSYDYHVPGGVRRRRMPVVLVLHGGGGNPALMRMQSEMDAVADRQGFIVVYPAGTNPEFTDTRLFWHAGRTVKQDLAWWADVDDVGFIAAVLDDLGTRFSIDRRRIYAAGISNGAQMCYRLAAELPIAAIGPVAGHLTVEELANVPQRGVPIIDFHGKQDPFARIDGGGRESANSPFEPYELASLKTMAGSWAAHNDCAEPISEQVGRLTVRVTYAADESEIVLWIIADGGHTWPGGQSTPFEQQVLKVGPVSQAVNASSVIAEFFSRHRYSK